MSKTVYIPMTRMNALGCLDSLILAPPDFLIKRKYYEDFTECMPLHVVAFTYPALPPVQHMRDGDAYNFTVLIEAELTSTAGIRTLRFTETGPETQIWKGTETEIDTALLLSNPLVLNNVRKIYVQAEEDIKSLQNDPLYQDREYKFSIEIYEESFQETGFFKMAEKYKTSLKKIKNYPTADYESMYKTAGGMALLAEVSETQEWEDVNPYVITIAGIADTYMGQYISLETYNFSKLMCFGDPANAKDCRLQELWQVSEQKNKPKKETGLLFNEPSDDIKSEDNLNIRADQMCLKLLIEECIKGHPKKLAATAIIDQVQKSISTKSESSEIHLQIERIEKGLQLIKDIMAGRESADSMFSVQTTWARSLRAATLFCLRHEPRDILSWTRDQKPKKAELSDYLRAAFLCGLYHGFSRLGWNVKKKWSAFLNTPVRCQLKKKRGKKKNRKLNTTWFYDKNQITGKIVITYPNKDFVEIKTRTDVNSLVQDFCDKAFPMALKGKLGIKEKSVLAIMANQMKLRDRNIYVTSNKIIQPGKLHEVKSNDIDIKEDWNYKMILEEIADRVNNQIPEEIVHLLSHYLGYPTHEFKQPEKVKGREDNIHILAKIDSYLDKAMKNVQEIAKDYPALGEIHKNGVRLGHELVNLLRIKKLNEKTRKEIQSALLYLVLEDDVISEEVDPVFGMIDDWIWLGYTAEKLPNLKKGNVKKITEISEAGRLVLDQISKEFGNEFRNTILKKIDLAFQIRKWITD